MEGWEKLEQPAAEQIEIHARCSAVVMRGRDRLGRLAATSGGENATNQPVRGTLTRESETQQMYILHGMNHRSQNQGDYPFYQ